MLKFAYILHIIICVAFGLTVWVHIDTYGTTPGCNLNSSVKFVVFGHSVAATNRGLRVFGIFIFCFIAVLLPFVAIGLLVRPQEQGFGDETNIINNMAWIWAGALCMAWVYEVATIEEIIRRNGVGHATSEWTFGQTFAVVLVIGPILDFGSAMWRYLGGNRGPSCPRCSTQQATSASYGQDAVALSERWATSSWVPTICNSECVNRFRNFHGCFSCLPKL